ncbi:guanylate kinase, putative [Ricinus communis]|uniref:Guanylate kinase, putative n=1 Tax=Ricinus communis TaxID=3988 RepID=B9RLF9_RICCO|nr:guanylate kinase, putative [Ricinus communis]
MEEDGFASAHGKLYATSTEAIEAVANKGKRCIFSIDVPGARLVRSSYLEAVFIFISPPSMEKLEKRLRARGAQTDGHVQC